MRNSFDMFYGVTVEASIEKLRISRSKNYAYLASMSTTSYRIAPPQNSHSLFEQLINKIDNISYPANTPCIDRMKVIE